MTAITDRFRLFAPFLDRADMVMCCPADIALVEINRQVNEHGLRFPLFTDPTLSLRDHMAATDYAPASARFGPYADNVLGMNWELPSGRVVRVGERVIKSTTGYDLVRFLLHSDGRYGHARDFVLRLRTLGGTARRTIFRGPDSALERLRDRVLRSPWVHWFDIVDLRIATAEPTQLEIGIDCAGGEIDVFDAHFRDLAHEFGTAVSGGSDIPRSAGLPVLSLKTTVTSAPELARKLVRLHGGTAHVLCVNGVVHYHPTSSLTSLAPAVIAELSRACTEEGGHVMGLWAMQDPPSAAELAWAEHLETAWRQL